MKAFFKTDPNNIYQDLVLLILRLTVAVFMLTHGFPKFAKLLAGGDIKFADPIGLGATLSFILVVFAEFGCSILIAIGLKTRWATIPLIVTMSVVSFVVKGPNPLKDKELTVLYLVIYLVLLVLGSGKFSLDYLMSKRKN